MQKLTVNNKTKRRFPKDSKLTSRREIAELLGLSQEKAVGRVKRVKNSLLKAAYLYEKGGKGEKFMVSVPKKLIRGAVSRNLLKRRIREAYRLNRNELLVGGSVKIAFIYRKTVVTSYMEIETAVRNILLKVLDEGSFRNFH